jgi:HTH-type transcriptional regulator / antitoxin HipB
MSDLQQYTEKRRHLDPEFAEGLDAGYAAFKVGVLLRQVREEHRLSQAEIAQRMNLEQAAIEQIETHPQDISLHTLERYAEMLGRTLLIELK